MCSKNYVKTHNIAHTNERNIMISVLQFPIYLIIILRWYKSIYLENVYYVYINIYLYVHVHYVLIFLIKNVDIYLIFGLLLQATVT